MFTRTLLRKVLQLVILTLPFTVEAHEGQRLQAAVNVDQSSKSLTSQLAAQAATSPTELAFQTAINSQSISIKADQLPTEKTPSKFSIDAEVSQSRNMIDFQDGSREDATEVVLLPKYSTAIGSFSAKILYAQNNKDSEDITNSFADTLLTYTYPSVDWGWKSPYVLFLNPGFTLGVPTSRVSQKQNQLKGAGIFNLALGIRPDQIVPTEHSWTFVLALTAGRNFYAFAEDINGKVLNQYSSNQTISLGYSHLNWSIAIDLINRSRWTFQNNVRQSFISNQEVGYAINDNLSFAGGHTNEASAQKANGMDSNLNFIDEKTSTVFATMGVSY
jgi:hypothetical protein